MLLNLHLMDLIYYLKNTRRVVVPMSNIEKLYMKLLFENKKKLLNKLILRFPIVQQYY